MPKTKFDARSIVIKYVAFYSGRPEIGVKDADSYDDVFWANALVMVVLESGVAFVMQKPTYTVGEIIEYFERNTR